MFSKMTFIFAIRWHFCLWLFLFAAITDKTHVHAHDVVEQTTMLDGAFVRSIFHTFRDFTFRWVQSTTNRQPRTRTHMLEQHHQQFPCDVNIKSNKVPVSVHRLRPGKRFKSIKVNV